MIRAVAERFGYLLLALGGLALSWLYPAQAAVGAAGLAVALMALLVLAVLKHTRPTRLQRRYAAALGQIDRLADAHRDDLVVVFRREVRFLPEGGYEWGEWRRACDDFIERYVLPGLTAAERSAFAREGTGVAAIFRGRLTFHVAKLAGHAPAEGGARSDRS